jgi:hypothetical protein
MLGVFLIFHQKGVLWNPASLGKALQVATQDGDRILINQLIDLAWGQNFSLQGWDEMMDPALKLAFSKKSWEILKLLIENGRISRALLRLYFYKAGVPLEKIKMVSIRPPFKRGRDVKRIQQAFLEGWKWLVPIGLCYRKVRERPPMFSHFRIINSNLSLGGLDFERLTGDSHSPSDLGRFFLACDEGTGRK